MTYHSTKSSNNWTLTYLLAEDATQHSVDPADSDLMANQVIMDHLVGTLVKYGKSGRLEPYLAEKWDVSADQKTWRFILRKGLVCEDNTPITSRDYIAGLTRQLSKYAKASTPIEFAKLAGWRSFQEGKADALGLKTPDDRTIEFNFEERPRDFLEFLRMVYFGYYCSANYENGNWRDFRKIISSGAFRLTDWDGKGDLRLVRREGWFSNAPTAPSEVLIAHLGNRTIESLDSRQIIISKKLSGLEAIPKGFVPVNGTPTLLNALVLSPYRNGPFANIENRRLFAEKFAINKNQIEFPSKNSQKARFFYPSAPSELKEFKAPNAFTREFESPLQVVISNSMVPAEKEYVKILIEKSLEGAGAKLEYHPEDRSSPGWFDKIRTNAAYDIRVARVDIGGQLLSAGIRMMFCTKMGVTFPDPTGKICEATNRFEDERSGMSPDTYAQTFNQLLYADAVVLPLFHSGLTWLYSEDIDLDNVTPGSLYPRFDLIHLK